MWSRMAKMPTFTTTYASFLFCPYNPLPGPTSTHFLPFSTTFRHILRGFSLLSREIMLRCEKSC